MSRRTMDLYQEASEWTLAMVPAAAAQPQSPTPCDDWTVAELLNHMLDTQQYFAGSARGEDVSPPAHAPATELAPDFVEQFAQARDETIRAFDEPGAAEKTGPALGIAFADQLLHGWDIARATGQEDRMPDGLAAAAYETIHGQFTDEQREGVFKAELPVGEHASDQERLLAYTGRKPTFAT